MTSGLLLSFYGDDFTGSTDAIEALTRAGLRSLLFLSPPSESLLRERFAGVRCIGVAGTSRAMTPQEMDRELAPILRELWGLGAPVLHYKVCSTFDSSPQIGNIGHVVDFARAQLNGGDTVSVLAGALALRRYTLFGNHFAAAGEDIFRLDRHPTMSRHPSTPMHEADLRAHLAQQTKASVALMSIVDLAGEAEAVQRRHAERRSERPGMLLYDVLDEARLAMAGRLIWSGAQARPQFAVGSSGVEYALAAHWREAGIIPAGVAALPRLSAVRQLLVLSGSASPMTAQQIAWAERHGFVALRADTAALVHAGSADATRANLHQQALRALAMGSSVVIYTAQGPDDPNIRRTREELAHSGNSAKLLGTQLGRLAHELLAVTGLRRLVIAGGDTSSYATQELGLQALEMLAELTPGAPLCRAYADDPRFDGLEIALKGGQMGTVDYFGLARGS